MVSIPLDMIDRKLLYELDINSRQSYTEIGKKLRIAKETARFRINRLKERGYIKNFLTTINVSRLNRFYYKLFYKFHQTTLQIDQEIVSFIKNYRSVAYFASTEGRYDLTFLVLAKDMHDLYSFLIPFREQFGDYILEQEILTMPAVHRFNLRFFYEGGRVLHTKYPLELKEPEMDQIDYHILQELARNSVISLIDLAKITNTETNVVKYRIKKLKKQGIIGTHVLEIDFEKFNLQHIQIDFSLKSHAKIEQMIEYAAQNPKATFATVTLGKYDLALEFVVENMKELRTIVYSFKEKFSKEIIDHDVFILEEHGINWFPYYAKNFAGCKTPLFRAKFLHPKNA
ncbi:Lrp/AsnC family transcriptional regulator [Candidatus Woesearchaeota archaeon]|nr:Lrp/AsnC family transcriptional regulator [Candidatus Woesearchaeota archaeon]